MINKYIMGKETGIQWCDSTGNIQMGCEGCELVKGQKKTRCYAHQLTNHYGGRNGWPVTFTEPKLFLHRLKQILSWEDLTGTKRKDKPWLDGLPRMIFLNDMGDTFSKGMPENWFAEVLPQIAESKHVFMLLTKWPQRLVKFAEKYPLPLNVWPGTTVTSQKTAFRAAFINNIKSGGVKWLSVEPMWSPIEWERDQIKFISLMIYGGESGGNALPLQIEWLEQQMQFCKDKKIPCFVKQLGSNVLYRNNKLSFKDSHAGNMLEWSERLRVRQFPFF